MLPSWQFNFSGTDDIFTHKVQNKWHLLFKVLAKHSGDSSELHSEAKVAAHHEEEQGC